MQRLSRWMVRLLVLSLVFAGLQATVPALATTTVFINEIHYDNAGTDTGEAIEIAGPAGTDLSGWSLVLYNGSNGQVYNTTPLSGLLPNQQGGYGTAVVTYPTNGIQNGSPDGLALVAPGDSVVQFLSYEGTFTAADGPAAGQTSVDIGVTEGSGTAIGESMQLTGSGSVYSDFAWVNGIANTFGAPNTGQTFNGGPPATPQVVINEVDYDQPGTDSVEFVELKNVGSSPVDLSQLILQLVNGNGGAVYQSYALPAVSLAAGDYFVVCANSANTPNCDLDVSPDSNLIQNGSPDAVALLFAGQIIDAVSYEGDTAGYTEGSGVGLEDNGDGSIGRCDDGADTDQNNVDFLFRPITPGATNDCPPPVPPLGQCFDPATAIHAIQGSGPASPEVGNLHTIEGVVVGDFQDVSTQLRGFFLQEEESDWDGDSATSEGIFVFDPALTLDVALGDVVRVQGTVTEFFDLTELTGVTGMALCASGQSATTTPVALPVSSLGDWERLEGMAVRFDQTLYVTGNFTQGRYGEVDLSVFERLYNPTNVTTPGPAALALQELNDRSRIQLDDGSTVENPPPLPPYLGGDGTLRGGDSVTGLVGVLGYSFGSYEIHPTQPVNVNRLNARTATPDPVGGTVRVASMNVLNFFNGDGAGGGFPTSRGADDLAEFQRQRDKIVSAIVAIDADVIGLMEIENDGSGPASAIQALVDSLNAAAGAGTYDHIVTGVIGTDEIRVGLLYQPGRVLPLGSPALLDGAVDARFLDSKNRPALAQSFDAQGEVFTVAVNHLKSKGSPCDDVGDLDAGDGQGNCNGTRTLAAQALVDWLATDPTGSGDPDVLIIGDLNAYALEDPIAAIQVGSDDTAGSGDDYTNLIAAFVGPDAYSYVFQGQAGYLDHALGSDSLSSRVTGVSEWHINADEPAAMDYNNYNQPALYAPDPFRSSDHDPVLVGFCDAVPPVLTVSVTPDVLWPPNHKMVDVEATVTASDSAGSAPTVTLVGVVSNEPDNGLGDGDTPNDIVIVDNTHVQLRAERAGGGSGRVYTITYTATDNCGNTTEVEATVTVPHNQGNGKKPKSGENDAAAQSDSVIPEGFYGLFLPAVQR